MYDQAITEFNVPTINDNPAGNASDAYAVAGRRAEAQKTIEELTALSKLRYVSPLYIAAIYAGMGVSDQAFSWLEKASEQHENMALVKTDEDFGGLRSDPRFADRLRRLGVLP
jgi:hypothetical protein